MEDATVEKTIQKLRDEGVRITSQRYEIIQYLASTHNHPTADEIYHACCVRCGKIADFYYPGLEDVEMAAGRLTGYQINQHRLEVYGLCPDCQKLEES